MTLEEQFIEDYAEGFSDASLLAIHAPEILGDIVQDNNPITDYFMGFFDGKQYYQEQEIQQGLEELQGLRDKAQSRDREHER